MSATIVAAMFGMSVCASTLAEPAALAASEAGSTQAGPPPASASNNAVNGAVQGGTDQRAVDGAAHVTGNGSGSATGAANTTRNTITITSSDPRSKKPLAPPTRPVQPAQANVATPGAAAPPVPAAASTVYRQVLPNGGTVYSDQPLKGAKVEKALTIAPLIKGNGWTTDTSTVPGNAYGEPMPIRRRSNNSEPGAQRTREDAQADVMRAEMLLEDAKRRLSSGEEPLPGERTGTVSGKSRLNQQYQARQESLERDVDRAESNLQQAITERNNIR
ncbi:MAG: hypothetical protein ACRYGK_07115 [Janthinobacterium lividum]